MKNYNLLSKERWDKGWPAFTEYYETDYSDKENEKEFYIYLKEKYGGDRVSKNIEEGVYFQYTPVPEEVACMALKMLSEERRQGKEIGNYSITRQWSIDYQRNSNFIEIYDEDSGKYSIQIGWENGELVQNVYDEDEEGRLTSIDVIHGEHNIFDISGYYEARNFGFTWHKE